MTVHAESSYSDQWQRAERLLQLVQSRNPAERCPGLFYYDVVVLCFQAMWNLRDWILNDPEFQARNRFELEREIFSSPVLRLCADIANATKHFRLTSPRKSTAQISDRRGFHLDTSQGICRELIYVVSESPSDPFHGMEANAVLQACHDTWRGIIDRHFLSALDGGG